MSATQGLFSEKMTVMSRRLLKHEKRPTRADMLRAIAEGHRKSVGETVCKGQCIYCDSDDDDGGSDGVDVSRT
jgi:hypothetical protein